MPRGGRRRGTQGAAYTNRTDLNNGPRQAITVASGQTYGQRQTQIQAQQAVPLPAPNPTPQRAPQRLTAPDQPVVPFNAPTQRPTEPVTTGLPMGAGPGPESLGPIPRTLDPTLEVLQQLYQQYPNNDLRGLLEQVQLRGT